jgi:hypothetical protein
VALRGQTFKTNSPRGPVLGTILLQPSNDGLFVIGAQNATLNTYSRAFFPDMALQPAPIPISNRQYKFRLAASPQDDLLRQVS